MSNVIKGAKVGGESLLLQAKYSEYPLVHETDAVSEPSDDKPREEPREELRDDLHAQTTKLIDEAKLQAASILSEANMAAERLIAEAQQQAAHLQDAAISQGKAAGFEEGKLQGYHETEALLNAAARIVEDARRERADIIERCEQNILELALAVATKVIHTELTINHDLVLAVVKDAIRKAKDQERVIIRVNPLDFETIAVEKQSLQMLLGREMGLDIRGDIGVDSGGCVIETDYGTIDARIDTQLDTVKKALFGMVKHG